MNTQDKLTALATYFDLMSMNGGARVYRTAREVGIFDATASGPMTAQKIAEELGLELRPLEALLDVLCSLDTMQREGECYSLKPVMQFLAGNYSNLGDEYWDHLPELLRTGVPLARMDSAEQSEALYTKQVAALAWMMKPAAESAAMMLGMGKTRTGLHILDVGAGSAVWSLTFAQKDSGTRVTALDWPAVLMIAEASARDMGLADRFAPLPGNYHEVEIPAGEFDMAVVANVTHIETHDGNGALFGKLYNALKPGGEIVVFDVMPGQEEGSVAGALYALGLTLRTEKGRVYTCGELESLLRATGFVGAGFDPIRVPPYTMGMIIARKEA